NIVNEFSRQAVENPATRALREGAVVGLANHTVLVSKNGAERAIDDSAAAIRRRDGSVLGVVLVFRDVAERRRSELAVQAVEKLRATRLAITQLLAEATSIAQAAQGILQAVCDRLDWDLGFYWVVDRETDTLRCAQSWHKFGTGPVEFEQVCR